MVKAIGETFFSLMLSIFIVCRGSKRFSFLFLATIGWKIIFAMNPFYCVNHSTSNLSCSDVAFDLVLVPNSVITSMWVDTGITVIPCPFSPLTFLSVQFSGSRIGIVPVFGEAVVFLQELHMLTRLGGIVASNFVHLRLTKAVVPFSSWISRMGTVGSLAEKQSRGAHTVGNKMRRTQLVPPGLWKLRLVIHFALVNFLIAFFISHLFCVWLKGMATSTKYRWSALGAGATRTRLPLSSITRIGVLLSAWSPSLLYVETTNNCHWMLISTAFHPGLQFN